MPLPQASGSIQYRTGCAAGNAEPFSKTQYLMILHRAHTI
jgi:hypothetical protein